MTPSLSNLSLGHVEVFEWDGTSYIQMGQEIKGVANDWMEVHVALSDSDYILAIGM